MYLAKYRNKRRAKLSVYLEFKHHWINTQDKNRVLADVNASLFSSRSQVPEGYAGTGEEAGENMRQVNSSITYVKVSKGVRCTRYMQ